MTIIIPFLTILTLIVLYFKPNTNFKTYNTITTNSHSDKTKIQSKSKVKSTKTLGLNDHVSHNKPNEDHVLHNKPHGDHALHNKLKENSYILDHKSEKPFLNSEFFSNMNIQALLTQTNIIMFVSLTVLLVAILIYIVNKKKRTRPHVKPPRIFTEGMNVDVWLDHFDQYIQYKNIKTPAFQTNYLKLHTSPADWKLIESASAKINKDNALDYNTLRPLMSKMFSTRKSSKRERLTEFLNETQRPEESFQLFYARLASLGPDVFPGYNEQQLDELIYAQFIHGIKDDQIRKRLLVDYGSNIPIADALEIAEKLLSFKQEDQVNKKDKNNNESPSLTASLQLNTPNSSNTSWQTPNCNFDDTKKQQQDLKK